MRRVVLASVVLAGFSFPVASQAGVGEKDPNIGFGFVERAFPSEGRYCTAPATVVVSEDPMGGYAIAVQVLPGTNADGSPEGCGDESRELIGNTANAAQQLTWEVPGHVYTAPPQWTLMGSPETGFHAYTTDHPGSPEYFFDLGPPGPATSIRWRVEMWDSDFVGQEYSGTIAFVR